MRYRIHRGLFLTLVALIFLFPFRAWSAQCYISKQCFAVADPNLVERVCYLYRHEARMYRPGQESAFTSTMPGTELHPDPLHIEFMQLMLAKKYMTLKAGTYVFSCKYDIEALRRDPASSASPTGGPPNLIARALCSVSCR